MEFIGTYKKVGFGRLRYINWGEGGMYHAPKLRTKAASTSASSSGTGGSGSHSLGFEL